MAAQAKYKSTVLVKIEQGVGYYKEIFQCKKCQRKWTPFFDADGIFYKKSYRCPRGCNKEFFEEVKK